MLAPAALTIPRRLIPTLMLAHHDENAIGGDRSLVFADLERHGVLAEGGGLTAEAHAVVGVMVDPTLVVSVEVASPLGRQRSTLWGTEDLAVWGRPAAGDAFELRRVDPVEIPLLLTQLTGVGHRPPPPFTGGVTVETAALTTAIDWRGDDPDGALGVLVSSGVEPVWADRLLIAHDHLRTEWTVSSVAGPTNGEPHVVELHVVDAGPAGYWRIDDDELCTTYTVVSHHGVVAELLRAVPDIAGHAPIERI